MKNKKASTGVILAITLVIVILVSLTILIIFLYNKGVFDEKEKEIQTIPLFINAIDEETGEEISVYHRIEYKEEGERKILSEHKLEKGWSEIRSPVLTGLFTIVSWSNEYYLVKGYKEHTQGELDNNKSATSPEMQKIGNISITHSGTIAGTKDILTINITSRHWYYKPKLCFAWTTGFLDVELKNNIKTCEEGAWKNQTFNKETEKYEDILDNIYVCGEDYFEKCKYVRGNQCSPENEEIIPTRYLGRVDSCTYAGESIYNSTRGIEIMVTSQEKTYLDEIKIYVMDMDRRWDEAEKRYLWKSEYMGENIGNEIDAEYLIKYGD